MNAAFALFAIEWTRPAGFLALALPLLVLVFARRRPDARLLATGTLAVWSRVDRRAALASSARRRIPLAIWLLALALAAGAFALAGPRPRVERAPATWRVVVDRSPSMYLADGRTTRIQSALDLVRKALARLVEPGDAIEWLAPGATGAPGTAGDGLATAWRSPDLPRAWLDPPRVPPVEPEWSFYDEPGTLWLSDRAPAAKPRAALACAGGGRAVPGPVAVEGATRWDWNGTELIRVPGGAPERAVRIEGHAALPEVVVDVFETWRAARGLGLAASAEASALMLRASAMGALGAAGAARTLEVALDGWSAVGSARGVAASADGEGGLQAWLTAHEPRTRDRVIALVTFGPGRIECALASLDEPAGDPTAFVVSWARLFDAALLAPPDVVALAERLSAGEAVRIDPESGTTGLHAHPEATASLWPAACAFVASALGLLALAAALTSGASAS